MKKIILLFVLFITWTFPCNAQELLQGKVYNSTDSTAIAGASVYFDGTNIGVSTDLDGNFRIRKNEGTTTPLIVSSLGFKTLVVDNSSLRPGVTLKIFLKESTEMLGEVFLETDPWSRRKKLGIFRREFLGNTYDAQRSKIKNEEAIELRYIPSKDILIAHAEAPLIITNKNLGYEVKYNLQNFKVEFSTGTSGLRLVHRVYYEGYTFFKELKNSPSKKILKNREQVYRGSSLHFMRALANRQLMENGFRIFQERFEVPPYQPFELVSVNDLVKVDVLKDTVTILYGDITQSLIAAEGHFYIDQWGNHSPPGNVIFGGAMGESRVARTLPMNYAIP